MTYTLTHSSVVNPDVVLCPFDLQGRCDDRECAYQHLCERTVNQTAAIDDFTQKATQNSHKTDA